MRFQQLLSASVLVAFLSLPAIAADYSLTISQAQAAPGQSVTVDLLLDPQATELSAVALYVNYDRSRLVFDSSSKSGGHLDNLAFDLPPEFAGAGIYLSQTDTIGLAVFDRVAPVAPFTRPQIIARLRFTVKDGVSGFAPIGFGDAPSAADQWGRILPAGVLTPGGVSVRQPTATSGPSDRDGEAAAAPGVADYRWLTPAARCAPHVDCRSRLRIHNSGDRTTRALVAQEGAPTAELTVLPHETKTWTARTAAPGRYLSVEANAPDLALTSTSVGPDEVESSPLPVVRNEQFRSAGEKAYVVGLTGPGSSLTLIDTGSAPAELLVTALDAAGSIVAAQKVRIEPAGAVGVTLRELLPEGGSRPAVVAVECLTADCSFVVFASTGGGDGRRWFQSER